MSNVRIHSLVTACNMCEFAHYESSGFYRCDKLDRRFDSEGRPAVIPVWCPLPVAAPEPAIIQVPEPGWEYQIVIEKPNGSHELSTFKYTSLPSSLSGKKLGFYTPSKRKL